VKTAFVTAFRILFWPDSSWMRRRSPWPRQAEPAGPNRNFPRLVLTFDGPLRQPNGNVVPAGERTWLPVWRGRLGNRWAGNVRVTTDWVVGGSLVLTQGKQTVTITAKVTDSLGRTGVANRIVAISKSQNGEFRAASPTARHPRSSRAPHASSC